MTTRIGRHMLAVPQSVGSPWRITTNKGDLLGHVAWHVAWRQFLFEPEILTSFTHDCLTDLSAFLVRETAKRKEPIRAVPLFGGGA